MVLSGRCGLELAGGSLAGAAKIGPSLEVLAAVVVGAGSGAGAMVVVVVGAAVVVVVGAAVVVVGGGALSAMKRCVV